MVKTLYELEERATSLAERVPSTATHLIADLIAHLRAAEAERDCKRTPPGTALIVCNICKRKLVWASAQSVYAGEARFWIETCWHCHQRLINERDELRALCNAALAAGLAECERWREIATREFECRINGANSAEVERAALRDEMIRRLSTAEEAARAEEREQCARAVEAIDDMPAADSRFRVARGTIRNAVNAIRARGKQTSGNESTRDDSHGGSGTTSRAADGPESRATTFGAQHPDEIDVATESRERGCTTRVVSAATPASAPKEPAPTKARLDPDGTAQAPHIEHENGTRIKLHDDDDIVQVRQGYSGERASLHVGGVFLGYVDEENDRRAERLRRVFRAERSRARREAFDLAGVAVAGLESKHGEAARECLRAIAVARTAAVAGEAKEDRNGNQS